MSTVPFASRPIISVAELASTLRVHTATIHKLCEAYAIPIRVDPTEGEMLSLNGVHTFLAKLHGYRSPSRFDRITLLLWMCGLEGRTKRTPPAYSERLESEIRRIRKLPPDDRVIRALELLERFVDAEEIVKSLQQVTEGNASGVKARARSSAQALQSLRGICGLTDGDQF